MKLILEQETKSYHCLEDNSPLLTVVTNREPDMVSSIVTKIIKGEQFPEIIHEDLPTGSTGIIYALDNSVVHTNIPPGFYYAYIRLKHLYFYYEDNKLVFYNSFAEIMAELWDSSCTLVELAIREKKTKEENLLTEQIVRQKIVEWIIISISILLVTGALIYPSIREQSSPKPTSSFEPKTKV